MNELLYSPIFYAILWSLMGAIQVAISHVRKEPLGFFQSINSLVYGPVALATELLQIAFTSRTESAASTQSAKELNREQPLEPIARIEFENTADSGSRVIKWNPAESQNRNRSDVEKKRA